MVIFETRGLVKWFGGVAALDDLDLMVPKGISGIVGPNGAGKTTTIHILLGLVRADGGEAYAFGMDCWSRSLDIRCRVGVLLEEPVYPKIFSGEKYIELVARLRGVKKPKQAAREKLREGGLYWAKDRKIGGYSAGMLQRLGIARALIGEPELVILDEPAANLDPAGRMEILEKIERLNRDLDVSFLISTHILPELERICDWILIIKDGRIVEQGSMVELAERYAPRIYEVEASNLDLLASRLRELDLAEHVVVKGHRIRCEVKDSKRFCREVLNLALSLGVSLTRLQPLYGVLEEAYRSVVEGSS